MANQIRPISPTDRWIVSEDGNVVGVQTSTSTDKGSSLFADAVPGDGETAAADFAALLATAEPTAGMRARTTGPVLAGGISGVKWVYDGSLWRLDGYQDLVVDFVPSTGTATTSEQTLKQWVLPAGLLASLRYMCIRVIWVKSGTTDAMTNGRYRLGTAGTSADAAIYTLASAFTATGRQYGLDVSGFAASSTQWRSLHIDGRSGGGIRNVPYPENTTIPSTAADMYLTLAAQMAGTTDTPSIANVIICGG